MPNTLELLPQSTFPAKSFAHLAESIAKHKEFQAQFKLNPVAALDAVGIKAPAGVKFPRANPFRAKQDPDDPGPDLGGGGGGPPIPTLSANDVAAGANGWGIVFTLSHDAAQAVEGAITVISQLLSIAGDVFPPAAFAVGLVSTFLSLNGELIRKVDIGNGVYLTVPWLLPGIVIPGSR